MIVYYSEYSMFVVDDYVPKWLVVVVVVVFISNCILLLFTYISDYISLHIISIFF